MMTAVGEGIRMIGCVLYILVMCCEQLLVCVIAPLTGEGRFYREIERKLYSSLYGDNPLNCMYFYLIEYCLVYLHWSCNKISIYLDYMKVSNFCVPTFTKRIYYVSRPPLSLEVVFPIIVILIIYIRLLPHSHFFRFSFIKILMCT
jgi:hypothetical protein